MKEEEEDDDMKEKKKKKKKRKHSKHNDYEGTDFKLLGEKLQRVQQKLIEKEGTGRLLSETPIHVKI